LSDEVLVLASRHRSASHLFSSAHEWLTFKVHCGHAVGKVVHYSARSLRQCALVDLVVALFEARVFFSVSFLQTVFVLEDLLLVPLALLLQEDPVRLSGVKTFDPCLPGLLFKLTPERGVIMILDVVVGPSWEVLCNLGPLVPVDCMVLQD